MMERYLFFVQIVVWQLSLGREMTMDAIKKYEQRILREREKERRKREKVIALEAKKRECRAAERRRELARVKRTDSADCAVRELKDVFIHKACKDGKLNTPVVRTPVFWLYARKIQKQFS
jgi:hypothetical protein